MRSIEPGNLEIPGLVLAHHPGMTSTAMPGLDPGLHRPSGKPLFFRSIAGSSPAATDLL
jgi:hypothetical protein